MSIKKPLLVMGALAGVGLAGITGLGVASAATSSPRDSIIDRIATKFNLNKGEVAKVFEEEKTARQAEMQQNMEARLDKAVKDGKLTEGQKAKILTKLEELKSNRQDWADKTPKERRQAMRQSHKELKQWAKDNDIPLEYLHFQMHVFRGGHGRGLVKYGGV